MRRVSPVDLMLLGTVLLWALNITVTKYVLDHGFQPLAYATIRYFARHLALLVLHARPRAHGSGSGSRDGKLVLLAALLIFVQPARLHLRRSTRRSAATVALILGTTPIFIGILVDARSGSSGCRRRFWVATSISFVGVGFVASGSGGFSADIGGDGLALFTAATWAGYSVTIAPLLRRYSPFRVSALVLAIGWVPLAIAGAAADRRPELPLQHAGRGSASATRSSARCS